MKLTVSMNEPQELFILTVHHPLRTFLTNKILSEFTKKIFKV